MSPNPPNNPDVPEMVKIDDDALLVALSRANGIELQMYDKQWFVVDTNAAEPEVNCPGELIAGPVSYEVAKEARNKAQAAEIRLATLQSIDQAGFVIVPREVLEAIERDVAHGLMGDWSIALRAIRERAALSPTGAA